MAVGETFRELFKKTRLQRVITLPVREVDDNCGDSGGRRRWLFYG